MLSGLDTKIIKENLKLSEKKFIVGGGLTSYEDIFKLKKYPKIIFFKIKLIA